MDFRRVALVSAGSVTLVVALVLIGRHFISSSPKPDQRSMTGAMNALPTDDLLLRRQFMASQIEQAQATSKGEPSSMLLSAQQSIAELDAILIERGVDVDSLVTGDRFDVSEAIEQEQP